MRIFIGDDEATVRSALKLLLEQRPATRLIGEACDATELLSRLPRPAPDAILLDWELPGKGDGLLAELNRASPGARVIVLSSLPESRSAALAAGAAYFMSKNDPPQKLLAILDKIAG